MRLRKGKRRGFPSVSRRNGAPTRPTNLTSAHYMPAPTPPYTLFFTPPILKTPTPKPRVKYITQTPAAPFTKPQITLSQTTKPISQQTISVSARPIFLASRPFFITQRSYDVAQHQYDLPQRLYGAAQHQYHETSQP